MHSRRLAVVGGVAGGASAAARARWLCEQCEIIVFERGPHVSFANCGLPFFVGGEIKDPNSVHIPLGQSRPPSEELPRDRTLIVHCASGQRSYFACRLLAQRGFKVRNLTRSWRTYQTAVAGGAAKEPAS